MSRIGKLMIKVPSGVQVSEKADQIEVKGPKGTVMLHRSSHVKMAQENGELTLKPVDDSRESGAQWGLNRMLLANAVHGVTTGFSKTLELVGVGYKVNLQGKKLVLNVGFSHPVEFELPSVVTAAVEGLKVILTSCDKQVLGEVAAQIRQIRKPEPYKGKGIKYADERIRRKAGKSGGKK